MRGLLPACALVLLAGCLASSAGADFTAPVLVSGTQQFQFDQAGAPALSGDGHYVVFQGSLAGVSGVYRRDLQTGDVEPVAVAEPAYAESRGEAPHPFVNAPDAAAPSVSADGRYVAFTTTADLQPEGKEGVPAGEPSSDVGCPEVYVRDMDLNPWEPGAYTLASALDGTDTGIAYSGCYEASEGFAIAGAQAAPAVALSADGRHVAFTVLSPSNLAGGSEGGQVAVRDLDTMTTTLVSATPEGEPTPGGGAYPSTDSLLKMHMASSAYEEFGQQLTASTAAISADASTVAWLGTNVPLQVPSATEIGAEGYHGLGENPLSHEVEPLWRRVANGQAAVTQRLLAGAGLNLFYHYGQEGSVLDGSFVGTEDHHLFVPPVLSGDGRTVAMIANAPDPAGESSFRPASTESQPNSDAYVVRVEAGAAETPRVTALTTTPDYAGSAAGVEDIEDIAMSSDGTHVVFDTSRTQFDLPSLALASPPVTYTGVSETYEANLALGTLQHVTSTYNGARPKGAAELLSLSADGQTLAFASKATNLFFGDGVPAPEVYVVNEVSTGAGAALQEVSAEPSPPPASPEWTLSVTASAQADGSVLVDAEVPGAGGLAVRAAAQLPATTAAPARGARRRAPSTHRGVGSKGAASTGAASKRSVAKGFVSRVEASRMDTSTSSIRRRPSGAGASRKKKSKHSDHGAGGGVVVPVRTVAQASSAAAAPSLLQLRLRVLSRYRSLVAGRRGLYAVLRVSFTAPGHPTLTRAIPVTFRTVVRKVQAKVRKGAMRRAQSRPAAGGDTPHAASISPAQGARISPAHAAGIWPAQGARISPAHAAGIWPAQKASISPEPIGSPGVFG